MMLDSTSPRNHITVINHRSEDNVDTPNTDTPKDCLALTAARSRAEYSFIFRLQQNSYLSVSPIVCYFSNNS